LRGGEKRMKIIDLRSDTVTLPTPAMREAINTAELGDDVYGEDPATNRLQEMAADMVGKEAALLVPSGTMGNLACVLTHCARREEVILGDKSHTFLNEAGGISALGGIQVHTVPNQADGTMLLEDIEAAIRGENIHYPRTGLICLENTHNRCSGSPLSPEYTDSVAALAARHGIKLHLDGARVFNAAVALGVDVREVTRSVDSMIFCLSKGLAAPIGSVICGTREFVTEALRTRKLLGGGMRQTGIIAAAGLVALRDMLARLKEDHDHARNLAEGIVRVPGLSIDLQGLKTNIIYFDLASDRLTADEFTTKAGSRGVKFLPTGPSRFRMVTHYGITAEDIAETLEVLSSIMEES
jgi:threonine aldolase